MNGSTTDGPADGSPRRVKLVVVGDSYTGKTSLLFAYTKKQFCNDYQTTIFDNYALAVTVNHRRYNINLFDTAGQEDYAHLRVLSYPQTDVFIMCFSLVDPATLEACRDVWAPEIRRYVGMGSANFAAAHAPRILLIGTKRDLWDEPKYRDRRVDFKQAERVANEIGCVKFLACSSLTLAGLKRVFDVALLTATGPPPLAAGETKTGTDIPSLIFGKRLNLPFLNCCTIS